jgi:predicted NodU family carbamoyl transferase
MMLIYQMSANKTMMRHQLRQRAQRRLIYRRESLASAVIAASTLKDWSIAHAGGVGTNIKLNKKMLDTQDLGIVFH